MWTTNEAERLGSLLSASMTIEVADGALHAAALDALTCATALARAAEDLDLVRARLDLLGRDPRLSTALERWSAAIRWAAREGAAQAAELVHDLRSADSEYRRTETQIAAAAQGFG